MLLRKKATALLVSVVTSVLLAASTLTIAEPLFAQKRQDVTVYVTRTGKKYHQGSCRYLSQSKIPMKLSLAREVYDPCKVCRPPN